MSIEAVGLTRRFGQKTAVDHVDLQVRPGEILALLGPNGAGKTTTVRMLAALLRPSGGTCRVAGSDVITQPEAVRRSVGVMSDEPGLYGEMRLQDYLAWFASLYRFPAANARRRVDDLIMQFGLDACATAALHTLSKGNQQRVALARALLHDPTVMLLDEPTAALDPQATVALRALFRSLRESGRTIVLCTHNLQEAEKVADTVAIIAAGRIVHHQSLTPTPWQRFQAVIQRDGAIDALSIEQVTGVQPGSVRIDGGSRTVEYATATPDATNPVVARLLVERGVGLVRLQEQAESLEEIYLNCLGGLTDGHPLADRPARAV